jgi:hypothetical protein
MQNSCQLTTLNKLGPRQTAISHQPPSLLFTDWLSTDNWTLSPTNQLLHITSHNWTADNSHQQTRASKYPAHNISTRTTKKTPFFYCCVSVPCRGNVFTEPLLTGGLHNPSFYCCLHVAGDTWQRPLFTESLFSNVSICHNIISK